MIGRYLCRMVGVARGGDEGRHGALILSMIANLYLGTI